MSRMGVGEWGEQQGLVRKLRRHCCPDGAADVGWELGLWRGRG